MLDLDIGSDAPGYFNNLLGADIGQFNINDSKYVVASCGITQLNPSRKTLLQRINLTNVTQLQEALDLSGSEKLRECRALGTQIQYVSFAEGAPLDCIHLPRSVTRIDLIEATDLTRILTTKPVVWEQNRETYTGLYIEDFTDNPGDYFREDSNTGNRIPIFGIDEVLSYFKSLVSEEDWENLEKSCRNRDYDEYKKYCDSNPFMSFYSDPKIINERNKYEIHNQKRGIP